MDITDLRHKKVAILGLGKEGLATIKYLLKHGVKPTLLDNKSVTQWQTEVVRLMEEYGLESYGGPDYLSSLTNFEVVFRSPGVAFNNPLIQSAINQGLIVTSQTSWFFNHTSVPIIGITGTKGKGTTSSLIHEVLKLSGKYKLFFTGNIGNVEPFEFIDDLTGDELIVYELSSFQLQDLDRSPHVGVCLMVTADHLDIHRDLSEYHGAKSAITKFQRPGDLAISNIDYEASKNIGEFGAGTKLLISSHQAPMNGVLIEGDVLKIYQTGELLKTLDCSNRILKGQHNMENIAAAYLAVQTYAVSDDQFLNTLSSFKGLEHRLEFVQEVDGVRYYNDSISTVPETSIAAIDAFDEHLVVLLGGSSKGLAMDALVEKLISANNIRAVALMGDVGSELQSLLQARGYNGQIIGPSTDFNQLMKDCVSIAEPGDVVLMSPGATSFGMFQNYSERGRTFKQLVSELSHE